MLFLVLFSSNTTEQDHQQVLSKPDHLLILDNGLITGIQFNYSTSPTLQMISLGVETGLLSDMHVYSYYH